MSQAQRTREKKLAEYAALSDQLEAALAGLSEADLDTAAGEGQVDDPADRPPYIGRAGSDWNRNESRAGKLGLHLRSDVVRHEQHVGGDSGLRGALDRAGGYAVAGSPRTNRAVAEAPARRVGAVCEPQDGHDTRRPGGDCRISHRFTDAPRLAPHRADPCHLRRSPVIDGYSAPKHADPFPAGAGDCRRRFDWTYVVMRRGRRIEHRVERERARAFLGEAGAG